MPFAMCRGNVPATKKNATDHDPSATLCNPHCAPSQSVGFCVISRTRCSTSILLAKQHITENIGGPDLTTDDNFSQGIWCEYDYKLEHMSENSFKDWGYDGNRLRHAFMLSAFV